MQKLSTMIKPVKTETQYEEALQTIYNLMQKDLSPGSSEANQLEIWSLLVKEYEREHYQIDAPTPIEAIKFRLEQMGKSENELNKILGSRIRRTEIMSGRKKLTLRMIRTLHKKLKIPAESLIAAY